MSRNVHSENVFCLLTDVNTPHTRNNMKHTNLLSHLLYVMLKHHETSTILSLAIDKQELLEGGNGKFGQKGNIQNKFLDHPLK